MQNTEFGYSRKDIILIGAGLIALGFAMYYGLQVCNSKAAAPPMCWTALHYRSGPTASVHPGPALRPIAAFRMAISLPGLTANPKLSESAGGERGGQYVPPKSIECI